MNIENNILTIEEKSNAFFPLILCGIVLIIGVPISYTAEQTGVQFILLFAFGAGVIGIFLIRSIRCVMDKNTGKILFDRGGIMDTAIDAVHTEYAINAVSKVEIKRFVSRGRDGFECRVVFENNERIRISQSGIGLSKCEHLARTVREFLELERPVAFVD